MATRTATPTRWAVATPAMAEPIDVDIHAIPPHGTDLAHFHYDVRFVLFAAQTTAKASPESLALRWIPLDRMASVTAEQSILRLATKCRSFQG